MTKKELLKDLELMPDDTEIVIGDSRNDDYRTISFVLKYLPGEYKDHQRIFDKNDPPSVYEINIKF
jgi:hypothetical protein